MGQENLMDKLDEIMELYKAEDQAMMDIKELLVFHEKDFGVSEEMKVFHEKMKELLGKIEKMRKEVG